MSNQYHDKKVKRVYLIRHGESEDNSNNNKLSGITDTPLSENGIQQCKQLAQTFRNLSVGKVYSSPLTRAKDTAQLVFPNSVLVVEAGLIEINYGRYEGQIAEYLKDDPIIQKWNNAPGDLQFPEGDHVGDHVNRVISSLKNLIEASNDDEIWCVSHRTTIRLLVSEILGIPLDYFRKIPCDNCSVTELDYQTDGLLSVNVVNATLDFMKK